MVTLKFPNLFGHFYQIHLCECREILHFKKIEIIVKERDFGIRKDDCKKFSHMKDLSKGFSELRSKAEIFIVDFKIVIAAFN